MNSAKWGHAAALRPLRGPWTTVGPFSVESRGVLRPLLSLELYPELRDCVAHVRCGLNSKSPRG
eukprot:7685078-Alexandrium_andersonii.AAC.1